MPNGSRLLDWKNRTRNRTAMYAATAAKIYPVAVGASATPSPAPSTLMK